MTEEVLRWTSEGDTAQDEEGVHMAADWAVTLGVISVSSDYCKIFQQDGFLIGQSSSARIMEVINHFVPWDNSDIKRSVSKNGVPITMRKIVSPLIKNALVNNGLWKNDSGSYGGQMLIAYGGQLFHVGSDLSFIEMSMGASAIGIGDEAALGSLASTVGSSQDRIATAILATCKVIEGCDCGSRGPAYFFQPRPREEELSVSI